MIGLVAWVFFFFKQKTAYEMRISDWSSDVCSSDLAGGNGELIMRKSISRAATPLALALLLAACGGGKTPANEAAAEKGEAQAGHAEGEAEIGRASCRERVCQYV